MTIIDAIKSGKRIRRKDWENLRWHLVGKSAEGNFILLEGDHPNQSIRRLKEDDILATDWVVEEEKKTFTSREILEAIDYASALAWRFEGECFTDTLLRKLGFKP